MALGIKTGEGYMIYEIPLRGMEDRHWQDRSWICEHLRQLADKIEETKFEIYTIGLEMNHQYNAPTLVVKGWEHKEEVLADLVDGFGTKTGLTLTLSIFQGFFNKRKWEIFERLINIEWCCPECGNVTGKPESPHMGAIQCKHCDCVLTHRTNGGQNNPFNWVFRRKEEK